MKTMYVAIGCNEDNDLAIGFQLAKVANEDGFPFSEAFTAENYVVHTGYHGNSHKTFAIGLDDEVTQDVSKDINFLFNESVMKKYEEDEFGYIDFDDDDLMEHFDYALQQVEARGYKVQCVNKEMRIYKVQKA